MHLSIFQELMLNKFIQECTSSSTKVVCGHHLHKDWCSFFMIVTRFAGENFHHKSVDVTGVGVGQLLTLPSAVTCRVSSGILIYTC